jgi:hypothetical protein
VRAVLSDAPAGCVYRHFAWFERRGGRWIGEWAGFVPEPVDEPLEAWMHRVQAGISPAACVWQTVEDAWDRDRWAACPAGGAVALDVGQFGWPVGDHVWHRWDDVDRRLDWPESSSHAFIEVDLETLTVIANQRSHRPVRPCQAGRAVLDITGTAWEPMCGRIFGQFVWRGTRWGFEPLRRPARGLMPAPVRAALAAGAVPFTVEFETRAREPIPAGAARRRRPIWQEQARATTPQTSTAS